MKDDINMHGFEKTIQDILLEEELAKQAASNKYFEMMNNQSEIPEEIR